MRKILLLALCLVFVPACHAQHTAIYVIDDFSSMLKSQVSPYLLGDKGAVQARNVRSNDIYGSLSKRREMLDYGSMGAFPVTSLHRYYKADDTKILLATGSTFIKSGNDDTGTFTTLRDQLSSGLRWEWVTYKDTAIGCNGTDNCQKYDGHTLTTANTDAARTVSILTSDLGAPFAELNTGSNLDASSWYQYKVAFYDGSTYYYSTARSNPILTGATVRDIYLTDIPLGPSGTTARYIYRTVGNASRVAVEADTTFYLVGTLSDNSTQVLADTVTDDVADNDAAPTWSTASGGSNITPPIFKHITFHKERLFGGNAPSYNSYIYWSDTFNPDIFPLANFEYIRVDDGDEITFLRELLGNLTIGKTNTITNMDTQNSDDTKWQVFTFSFIGCPAPYSDVYSPLGIIYLGWDGIYVYNGESSQLISDSVTKNIRDILVSNISEVTGVYFQNEYHLAYTSESSGASENNVVLVLDTVRDSYVIDDKSINAFEVFDSGTDYGTLYSGASDTTGDVLAHESSLQSLNIRYKSELDAGTTNSIAIGGTQNEPEMRLGWGIVINHVDLIGTINSLDYAVSTINQRALTGSWWSQAVNVNASDYSKLYWHETLGADGNVTFAIRSAATESAVTNDSLAWSSEFTDPSGSDVSGETADAWVQLRSTLSSDVITSSPTVDTIDNYMIRLVYSRVGTGSEGDFLSIWESGFLPLNNQNIGTTDPKRIWGIDLYYVGTEGTLTVGLENDTGDIDQSFDINLATAADVDPTDQYFADGEYKIYKWLVPINSEDDPTPIGRSWQFTLQETGVTAWRAYKMVIKYSKEEYYEE